MGLIAGLSVRLAFGTFLYIMILNGLDVERVNLYIDGAIPF